jgi:PhnB protein
MKTTLQLSFDGRCEEALKFYEKALGGKLDTFVRWGGSPAAKAVPPEWHQKVLHATIVIGGLRIGVADAPPERYQKPQGISVTLQVEEPAEADRLFKALAEGGTVDMPCQETFWAKRFGMVTDAFGIPWMVNCGKTQHA